MKNLSEYIYESIIFEANSLNKLSEILADKIIDRFKKEEFSELPDIGKYNVDNSKTVKVEKIKNKNYKDGEEITLYISYSDDYKNDAFLNDISLKKDNNAYIIIKADISNIDNTDETLAHEIRHFYDKITGQDNGDINNIYEDGDTSRFEAFLYYISPTEQNAHTVGFKKWIKKDNNLTLLKNTYNKLKSKDVDSFIESFSNIMIKRRHNYLKNHGSDDETQLTDFEKGETYNPVRLFEYKYYILNSIDNFKKYVQTDLSTDKERNDDTKKYILSHLNNLDTSLELNIDDLNSNDFKKLYKIILSKYNQTFKTFKQILINNFK